MHHLVLLNPPRKMSRRRRTGKMPAALARYWRKHRKTSMKAHRRRRHSRRRHVRRTPGAAVRRHYRSHRRRHMRRHVRRNPVAAIRRHHRRRHHRRVRHIVRHVVTNPRGGALNQIGGVVAGQLAITVVDGLVVSKLLPTMSGSGASSLLTSSAVTAGLGIGGYYLLRRSMPNFAIGVGAGAVTLVAVQLLAYTGLSIGSSLISSTQGAVPYGGAGYGGYAQPGYAPATGAYLGAIRRRRRMAAYLGGPRRRMGRRMGAYLAPGKPIQSMVGPVTPTAKTFGHQAGALSGFYTGPSAFTSDAWKR